MRPQSWGRSHCQHAATPLGPGQILLPDVLPSPLRAATSRPSDLVCRVTRICPLSTAVIWDQIVLSCGDRPMCCRVRNGTPGLHLRCQQYHPSYDNPKCLQVMPSVPRRGTISSGREPRTWACLPPLGQSDILSPLRGPGERHAGVQIPSRHRPRRSDLVLGILFCLPLFLFLS